MCTLKLPADLRQDGYIGKAAQFLVAKHPVNLSIIPSSTIPGNFVTQVWLSPSRLTFFFQTWQTHPVCATVGDPLKIASHLLSSSGGLPL
jgi:hypothetical protein